MPLCSNFKRTKEAEYNFLYQVYPPTWRTVIKIIKTVVEEFQNSPIIKPSLFIAEIDAVTRTLQILVANKSNNMPLSISNFHR